MLLAAPVLHHEAEVVGIEEEALRVARAGWPQVDDEHYWKLEALGGVYGQHRDRIRTGRFLGGLADGQLGVDDLVEVAHEVADSGEGDVALESPRQLKDLAQVEQGARAAVALGAKFGPAQVTALFEEAVEDVGDRERVAQPADAVGELDQAHRLGRDLRLHLGKSLAPGLVEAVAKPHAGLLETA